MEEVPQACVVLANRVQFTENRRIQILRILRCEVAQPVVLQPRPYLLHRFNIGA